MRKTTLALAALLSFGGMAHAANLGLPTKAPAQNLLTFPYTGSGFYWGVATKFGAEQDSASTQLGVQALATGNVNAMGAGVGGTLGWMHGMGTTWVAVEGNLYYQNVTGGANAVNSGANMAVPASFASRWSADQVVKIGGWNPLSVLGNLGITFPTLPSFPTVSGVSILPNGHTYFMAGVEEWGIDGQLFTAGGTTTGVAALVGAGIMNQIQDATGKPTGAVLDTGAQVVFADKGLQINGLFANPGIAPTFSTLTSGRKYEGFAKVLF